MRYAVIDIETTGGLARRDRITEIAVVVTDGVEILDQFSSLVNPECSIPYFITSITGITNDMVVDAPRFFEIAKKIVEITKDTIFVAHNVRFDYGFIREEFKRLGYTFSKRQLCTVRLSRKVFPELEKHSLEYLINHFEITAERRHRALDDALATQELLQIMLEDERAHPEIDHLINLGIKSSKLPASLNMEDIIAISEETGIYYFKNKDSKIVYFFKSKNIQKRVVGHFTRTTKKALALQQLVHEIDYHITGSELIALLKENEEIKKHQPDINKAQRSRVFPYGIYAYYSKEGYLCLEVASYKPMMEDDQIRLLKLFKSKDTATTSLKILIEEFELCPKLCKLDTSSNFCFNHSIKTCHGACRRVESYESYNQRALSAEEKVSDRFEKDFLLIDDGRNHNENGIILVQNGICTGYGYIDQSVSITNLEVLKDKLSVHIEYTADVNAIIRKFMKQSKKYRLKYF